MFTTRLNGVVRDRKEVREGYDGELEIVETREPDLKRTIKVARLTTVFDTFELFEAQILWIADDKMCLGGFERRKRGINLVDYAQSWACTVLIQERVRKRLPPH